MDPRGVGCTLHSLGASTTLVVEFESEPISRATSRDCEPDDIRSSQRPLQSMHGTKRTPLNDARSQDDVALTYTTRMMMQHNPMIWDSARLLSCSWSV